MSDPTPKPTAEVKFTPKQTKALGQMVTLAQRKAFKEAAALRPEYPETADGTYSDGWHEGCNEYAAMLTNRALAKEQADG